MRASTGSSASVTHCAVIERCRRTLTALWAPLFSLSSSHSPREPFSLPFIWFSWAGAPCLVYPVPSSFSSRHPSFPAPPPSATTRRGPLDPVPLTSQQDIPEVSPLSLIIALNLQSLFVNCQTDPPYVHASVHKHTQIHKNTHKLHLLINRHINNFS